MLQNDKGSGPALQQGKVHLSISGKNSSCSTGTDSLERLWALHPWNLSELSWPRPQATSLSIKVGPALSRRLSRGPFSPQLFSDSLILFQKVASTSKIWSYHKKMAFSPSVNMFHVDIYSPACYLQWEQKVLTPISSTQLLAEMVNEPFLPPSTASLRGCSLAPALQGPWYLWICVSVWKDLI